MFKKALVGVVALLGMANLLLAFECSQAPSKKAEQTFLEIVEDLVRGDVKHILNLSVKEIQNNPQTLAKMAKLVSSYGEPKTMNLVRYKCYSQKPGYERFYGVLCYSRTAVGVDITLKYTSQGFLLHHLHIELTPSLMKACQ